MIFFFSNRWYFSHSLQVFVACLFIKPTSALNFELDVMHVYITLAAWSIRVPGPPVLDGMLACKGGHCSVRPRWWWWVMDWPVIKAEHGRGRGRMPEPLLAWVETETAFLLLLLLLLPLCPAIKDICAGHCLSTRQTTSRPKTPTQKINIKNAKFLLLLLNVVFRRKKKEDECLFIFQKDIWMTYFCNYYRFSKDADEFWTLHKILSWLSIQS